MESESFMKDFLVEYKMEDMVCKRMVCNESGIFNVFLFVINSLDLVMVNE